MARLICVFALVVIFEGLVQADCGGRVRATPVRNLIASRPILTTLQKIRSNVVRASCSGQQAVQSSCSGPQVQRVQSGCSGHIQTSCSGSSIVPTVSAPMPKVVKFVSAPVVDVVEHQQQIEYEPICNGQSCEVVRKVLTAPIRAVSSAYQQALASAQYRAVNRIRGHSYLDTNRTSGVGWSTSDPTPATCLGRGGSAYAVVRGDDGYFYATKFAE
jgi:hypothetical protein